VIVTGSDAKTLANGRLSDVAPTLLRLMDLPQPKEMTGKVLLR
jgi:2,3-bisphosphoglycerate-independent phosphoglycerate mutase